MLIHKKEEIDFTDQIFFIGIDVHKKQWNITIRLNKMELKTFSMDPSPMELYRYLNTRYPRGTYRTVYEAGFCGFWIHRSLQQYGIDNIVIHPADVPTTNKEKTRKTDSFDSRKLSRELESHSLKAIFVPDEINQQLRSLVRLRARSVQNEIRVKNRIKGFLSLYGISLPLHNELCHWSGAFIKWLATLKFATSAGDTYLQSCLGELNFHRQTTLSIVRQLRQYCRQYDIDSVIKLLYSVPGVGFTTAMTLYTEIIDINRFSTLDHLASYVGLVPFVQASGEHEYVKGLSPRKSTYLRSLLIEAAWIAVRHDPALTQTFARLIQRMPKQQAIIRIAKKLLSRIRHVWLYKQPYVPTVGE